MSYLIFHEFLNAMEESIFDAQIMQRNSILKSLCPETHIKQPPTWPLRLVISFAVFTSMNIKRVASDFADVHIKCYATSEIANQNNLFSVTTKKYNDNHLCNKLHISLIC